MNEEGSSKKIWIILGVIILFIVIALGVFFMMSKSKATTGGSKGVGSLFGFSGAEVARPIGGDIHAGSSTSDGYTAGTSDADEPLFRQLSTVQVAGATSVTHGGQTFVRYIARENGFVYEVNPVTGASRQLTNTTVPRIYEAYWGNGGNSVVIRYLFKNPLTKQDIIRTEIGDLVLPIASSTTELGSLEGLTDRLPDNISQVSVSPNGKFLLYLLPVSDGVSGTIVTLNNRGAREVLRNSFSEWLPQMLNNGHILLTTKPSWDVPGFSYLYNTDNRTLSRVVREKNGLTTLGNLAGSRVLYNENVSRNTVLSMYDEKGFSDEDGQVTHTAPLQLATLPEKCAWSGNDTRIFCAAFADTAQNHIPDDWYQGTVSLRDTFWTIDTNTSELVYLADPQKEVGHNFDVLSPFIGGNEKHLFFINKNDFTVWSMRLQKEKYETTPEAASVSGSAPLPELTPEEMKDAAGSVSTNTPVSTTVQAKKPK